MKARGSTKQAPRPRQSRASAESRKKRSRYYVLASFGEAGSRTIPAASDFPACATAAREELSNVLADFEEANVGRVSQFVGGWMVLEIDVSGFSAIRPFVELPLLHEAIKRLLEPAIDRFKNRDNSAIESVTVHDTHADRGQLTLRVVFRENREQAEAFCEQMAGGGDNKPSKGDGSKKERRVEQIKALLDAPVEADFETARTALASLGQLTREEIAHRLSGPLNAALRVRSQEVHEQRQAIASWVNGELRAMHLAIRDFESGRPAILAATLGGKANNISRFRLQIRTDDGRQRITWSGRTLPELELMPDVPRVESLAKWTDRVRESLPSKKQR